MSEHRTNSARKVIPLPVRDDEEGWPPALLEKMQERMWLLGEYIESCGETKHADLYLLTRVQQEIFELCELYFAGLGPSKAKAVVEQIAPKWARFNELVESNRTKAQALSRKRAS